MRFPLQTAATAPAAGAVPAAGAELEGAGLAGEAPAGEALEAAPEEVSACLFGLTVWLTAKEFATQTLARQPGAAGWCVSMRIRFWHGAAW